MMYTFKAQSSSSSLHTEKKIFSQIFSGRSMDTVDNDDIESVPKVHRHADAMSQRLKTLDKNFEERVNMVMRTNADTVNECTNIVVAREDAVCMFRRGEISIAEARRAILNIRMRAASENVMTPSVEAPSGYHQGFVSVRTPYDQVGANYRKWVVLDYEHDGRRVMRICNRRNGSPDEVIRDVVCWFTPESCVIPYCNTAESKISSEEEVVTELSLSIDGVYMSTGTSEILRNRYQVVMSFCVKNMDVMMQWYAECFLRYSCIFKNQHFFHFTTGTERLWILFPQRWILHTRGVSYLRMR